MAGGQHSGHWPLYPRLLDPTCNTAVAEMIRVFLPDLKNPLFGRVYDHKHLKSSSRSGINYDPNRLAAPPAGGVGGFGSASSNDGSTDSLLEQDLHNLSLAVTQQALD